VSGIVPDTFFHLFQHFLQMPVSDPEQTSGLEQT